MSSKQTTLADLFAVKLQGLYDAEKQLVGALTNLANQTTSPRLRMEFENHAAETRNHVSRLEQVARNLNLDLAGPSCKAMEGLVAESEQVLALHASDEVRDAALLATVQGVEHYEIAQYGTVMYFAKRLGHLPEAALLRATLTEEKNTNESLNQLAINFIDEKALP